MTLTDALLGRRDRKRARSDLIHGIAAARAGFEVALEVRAAAIAFEPPATPRFDELLVGVGEDTGAAIERTRDGFGLTWVALSGTSLDDLALSVGVLAEALELAGCWEQVICAVFAFRRRTAAQARVYWVYNFERGTFYPFVPQDGARRDGAEEARLRAAVERDLRLEQDPQRWHPLWDLPV